MMEIDLVYLWVDGNDPQWQAKKRAYMPADSLSADTAGDCRYVENDELRYSLRSAEKFAPWIRRIFIVTDGQTPAWLDTTNPKIQIVDHSQIVPAECLPCFNSCLLEWYIDRIPGLSEYFIYGNDDTLFGAPVTPDFFFNSEGLPIVRLKKQSIRRHLDQVYPSMLYRSQQEVARRYNKSYSLAPHHNIDAYRKSDFSACKVLFSKELQHSAENRFRSHGDLYRSVVAYSALARGQALQRAISRFNGADTWKKRFEVILGKAYYCDSRCIPLTTDIEMVRKKYIKYNPKLFCINDNPKATQEAREGIRVFLEQLFPEKSQFEK